MSGRTFAVEYDTDIPFRRQMIDLLAPYFDGNRRLKFLRLERDVNDEEHEEILDGSALTPGETIMVIAADGYAPILRDDDLFHFLMKAMDSYDVDALDNIPTPNVTTTSSFRPQRYHKLWVFDLMNGEHYILPMAMRELFETPQAAEFAMRLLELGADPRLISSYHLSQHENILSIAFTSQLDPQLLEQGLVVIRRILELEPTLAQNPFVIRHLIHNRYPSQVFKLLLDANALVTLDTIWEMIMAVCYGNRQEDNPDLDLIWDLLLDSIEPDEFPSDDDQKFALYRDIIPTKYIQKIEAARLKALKGPEPSAKYRKYTSFGQAKKVKKSLKKSSRKSSRKSPKQVKKVKKSPKQVKKVKKSIRKSPKSKSMSCFKT